MATHIGSHTMNGIDLDVLKDTFGLVESDPENAKCRFRVRNKWLQSTRNQTTVCDFFAAKQDISHKQTVHLEADEPPMLAGTDDAPNPVEHLLNALAACVTTSIIAHAAVRGIKIDELESQIEGDIDLRGFFGMSKDVPKGFSDIRVSFKVKTDEKNLDRLKELADFSPVYNTLTHGVNVDIRIDRK